MIVRKVAIALLVLAAVGAAVFWFVTRPSVVSASALGPHTANLDNGRTMFYAGGCASCHATPDQDDKTKLGGGMALKTVSARSIRPIFPPMRKTGSAAGARRILLPPCGRERRPKENIITRRSL